MHSKERKNLLEQYIVPTLITEAKEFGLDLSNYVARLVAEDQHSLSAVFFEDENGRWVTARFETYGRHGDVFTIDGLKFELSQGTEATMIEYLSQED